jgi:pSer/pThr/pTyr-binding forkhead associated (FHA) protein
LADGADLLWQRGITRSESSGPFRLVSNCRLIIGRSPTASLRVNDPFASHKHLELECDEGRWYAHDMNSENGTRISGETIVGHHRVRHGDIIELGAHTTLRTPDLAASFLPLSELSAPDMRTLRALAIPLLSDPDAEAATNREVAEALHIGIETVKSDVARLLRKAGLSGRGHRTRLARRGAVLHRTKG